MTVTGVGVLGKQTRVIQMSLHPGHVNLKVLLPSFLQEGLIARDFTEIIDFCIQSLLHAFFNLFIILLQLNMISFGNTETIVLHLHTKCS